MRRRILTSGRVVWVVDRRGAGARTRTACSTRADADRLAGLTEREVCKGRTLGDAVAAAIARAEARGRSHGHLLDLRRTAALLRPIACVRLDELSEGVYRAWDARRRRGGESWRVLVRVRIALAEAVRRGWITRDPLAAVAFRRPDPPPVVIHSVDEALKLIELGGPLRLWFALGYLAGLRPSEAFGLQWSQVEQGRLMVVSAKARSPRVRQIEIVPRLGALLAGGGVGPVVACGEWVVRNRLAATCSAAGVTWSPDVARHTCASHLLALWRDSARVALFLGHASVDMLWRYYRAPASAEDAQRLFGV